MKTITITIAYEPMNSQSDELAGQEIRETVDNLANSLRTQVNDVKVAVVIKPE